MKLFKKTKLEPTKLAIMASGRGSNFEALYAAIKNEKLNAEIKVLVSDNPESGALTSANNKNIPAECCNRKSYSSKEQFEIALISKINEYDTDLIILAGYMRILGKEFVDTFEGKILNIHPSLLPSFPGLHAQKQALDYGVKYSGCTVHYVDAGLDSGPIIMQRTVPVLDNDTEKTLSLRILKEEHDIYWRAIKLITESKLHN